MFKVDDIPDQVLRDIVGAYHRRLASTDTENQPEGERDFQRMVYLRTALEWLALWLNEREPAARSYSSTTLGKKLWIDCKTDRERSDFILSGRAYETGVISHAIQADVAMAFHRLALLAAQQQKGDK